MTSAATLSVAASPYEQVRSAEQASSFTPAQFREAIAHWVGQDRLDIADALAAAGLGLYPDSADVLAISSLLSEIHQDWAHAQLHLERLIQVQGDATTGESWFHLVRVMRCRQAYFPAFTTARHGLEQHPAHAGLQQEFAELQALLQPETVAAPSTSMKAHAF